MLQPRFFVAVLVFAGLMLTAARAGDAPLLFTSDGADLAAAREKLRAGDDAVKDFVEDQVKAADKAMLEGPWSVTQKDFTPPSGDKHDYMSLSPYWWPDPSKPDGKPYIRRDGEFNPEREKYDLEPLEKMSRAVESLGFAYYFTGDEKYAARSRQLLRAWFIDAETRMNPNLRFAQFVPGYDATRPSGIIEGGRFRRVVDGVGLIAGSANWSAEDDAAVKAWFKELLQYILTSEQGTAELAQANNHGSWATVQVATYALFTGERDTARQILETQYKQRIASQIKPDGTQPEELARTNSFHYSRFNILALVEIAMLGERVGLDLWNYKTDDGKSLRTAIDFMIPYATQEKPWPYQQISEIKYGDMIVILRRAANAYNDAAYEAAAMRIFEKDKRQTVNVLFPSRLK